MKTPALGILTLTILLLSCSENQVSLPEPETQLNQLGENNLLDRSTLHPGKIFAD